MNRRSDKRVLASDPLWFKNAIIYEVHVKAYYDSNGDGIGDFPGLTQKLDYIQNLGVNTIWLLPFFSSPLRDDGYDIADYLDIHPTYGTLADFRRFLREAHSRNIRVIIELVVNHTSDAHPWFQAARRAPKGSNRRNFYVWNDDDDKYKDARIIFTDSETSNWSWDPVAKSYYWHRFFSHQPDLNFNNPQVVKKLVSVMKFWLDLGVDGLRLDAVPYLCERDGTNCENLPETHEIIKTFRREMDTHYQDRIFLAEANQWPEDAAEYFGSGDECHMAFHFPLMPRIYMALALEERFPIVEILKQTPDIPPNCQWAVFLRNHDELTLEMVTNKERDYMYEAYANEPRARINVGIRRRLAPLMEYSRAKIELMNALLLSICGSPVIYYGDEIGMGDNLFLGDRNGVRTPMQWTPDRNGGFSAADPERLFLPPVMEAITGFQAVNVEAQKRNPSSLLNWMKRLISVRKQFKAFGEGTLEFIKPANRNILAFVRNHADGNILCVANLSRSAQPVHLDLQKFKGYTPVEMLGKNQFPTISDEPYQLSLAAYGFYWFELSITATGPAWQSFDELTHYELPVLVFRAQAGDKQLAGLQKLLADKRREKLLLEAITQYFTRKRWFAGKNRQFSHISLDPVGVVASKDSVSWGLAFIMVHFIDGGEQKYFFPCHLTWDNESALLKASNVWVLAKTRQQNEMGCIIDSLGSDEFCRSILNCMQNNTVIPLKDAVLKFSHTSVMNALQNGFAADIRRPVIEQSNTSVFFGEKFIFKIYRQVADGENPELQMGKFLTESQQFTCIARVAGAMELIYDDGRVVSLGILQEFVDNQSDCWNFTLNYLYRFIETCLIETPGSSEEEKKSAEFSHEFYLSKIQLLGRRVGELHALLARENINPAFKPEKITREDWKDWSEAIEADFFKALALMESDIDSFSTDLQPAIKKILANQALIIKKIGFLIPLDAELVKTRHHGDLHLGQVLLVADDFIIIDFEGEPARPLCERVRKHCPLRDVAGMMRSFSYAAETVRRKVRQEKPELSAIIATCIREWEKAAIDRFLHGYIEETVDCMSVPKDRACLENILRLLCIEKALYEFSYERTHRPEWLEIPVSGLIDCLQI